MEEWKKENISLSNKMSLQVDKCDDYVSMDSFSTKHCGNVFETD